MRLRSVFPGVALLLAVSCTERELPTAPTAVAGPTPPPISPSLPTTVPGVLTLALPIDAADVGTTAFGLAPFGYHGADHAEDGHPGWDVEYRVGGIVRAAAAGTVQSVGPDAVAPGRFTVQLAHVVGAHHYRTIYTNVAVVNAAIRPAEVVGVGQPLGTAGTIGTSGTIHFQLDDFEYYRETSHPNAVSPEPFLSADAKSLFDRMWLTAAYVQELVEPYPTNPRELSFPASRTWTRAGGDGPAGIRFTRRSARVAEYEYSLLAESGTVIETGTVTLTTTQPVAAIALVSPTAQRLGIYEIVSNELRLSLAGPGQNRPVSLGAASTYRTGQ